MQSPRASFRALLVAGVIVHAGVLAIAVARTGRVDGYAFRSLDCDEFYAIAMNVAHSGTFSRSESPPLEPDTWRTPGYPVFLAFFVLLLGDSPVGLVIVQQLLSILSAILLFAIVRRWMSERRALLAAGLFLLEPYHLYYSLWLMSTTLFVAVLLLLWLTWNRALESGRLGWFALLGVLGGSLILVRPVGSLVPVALLLGVLVVLLRNQRAAGQLRSVRVSWSSAAVLLLCCGTVMGSWMWRNRAVAGHFALSDQGGVVLAYFKAAEVELWRQGRSADRYIETSLDPATRDGPHTVWDEIDARLRERFSDLPDERRTTLQWSNLAQGNRSTADSFEVSRALGGIGWSYLWSAPWSTAACCTVRLASLLTFPMNLAVKPATGVEISRLGSFAKGGVYLALLLAVVVRLCRRCLRFEHIYFPLACTLALGFATTPQFDPRFRVPLIPFLLVLALLPRGETEAPSASAS